MIPWDYMGVKSLERSRSRSPQPISFPIPHTSPPNYGYTAPVSSSYPSAIPGFAPYVTHGPSSAPPYPAHFQPPPQHVIHIIHHPTPRHKHKEDAKKAKSKKDQPSLHHTVSSSRLNLTVSTAVPFPIARSNPSPQLPHQPLPKLHPRSRSHSLTAAAQPQVKFLREPISAPPVDYSAKNPPSNLLHKRRPSINLAANNPNISGDRLRTPLTPVLRPLTPPPQTKPLHGILKPSVEYPLDGPASFQYSKCTGRKRALCIGINYNSHPDALRGSVNDARHVRDFLIKQGGYRVSEILLLTDEPPKGTRQGDGWDQRMMPTRENIIRGMKWLVRGARKDDSLFLHYSGHSGPTQNLDLDEMEGYNEVICPVDFRAHGNITDDEMYDIMIRFLPIGCRLTGLFDACHLGTVLDLPYIYSPHGRLKGSVISAKSAKAKTTSADVISWSSCKDGEINSEGMTAIGAMSYAFITSLSQNPHQSYQELLRSIRHTLGPRFAQKPQLGSSHQIDTNRPFIF